MYLLNSKSLYKDYNITYVFCGKSQSHYPPCIWIDERPRCPVPIQLAIAFLKHNKLVQALLTLCVAIRGMMAGVACRGSSVCVWAWRGEMKATPPAHAQPRCLPSGTILAIAAGGEGNGGHRLINPCGYRISKFNYIHVTTHNILICDLSKSSTKVY